MPCIFVINRINFETFYLSNLYNIIFLQNLAIQYILNIFCSQLQFLRALTLVYRIRAVNTGLDVYLCINGRLLMITRVLVFRMLTTKCDSISLLYYAVLTKRMGSCSQLRALIWH